MRKLLPTALVIVAVLASSTAVVAQPASSVGWYFTEDTPEPDDRCAMQASFATFFIHLIAHAVPQIAGWEASVTLSNAEFNVLGRTLNPGTAVDVGVGDDNFVVGLGGAFDGSVQWTLVSYQMGYFGGPDPPVDTVLCTEPSSPTSFTPPTPGWADAGDNLIVFTMAYGPAQGGYPAGCGVVNPTMSCIVPIGDSSWGAVKSKF